MVPPSLKVSMAKLKVYVIFLFKFLEYLSITLLKTHCTQSVTEELFISELMNYS